MIPVYKPDLNGNEKKYLNDCIDSSWISSKGKYVKLFEERFKEYTGAEYATTVANGTLAMHLSLLSLEIGLNDEVVVPTLTYIASVNSIKYVGATPVFVDSLKDTWQIDPKEIVKKITNRTKAIVVVHLYGQSANMEEILKISKENNLYLIEDCAEALGTYFKDKHVGTFGDVGAFSFYGNKTITCGEGGMVITKNHDIYKKVNKLKNQGLSDEKEYWHDVIGFNYRMTNMQAAIGMAQLERIEYFLKRKRQIAKMYMDLLSNLPLDFHIEQNNTIHSFWMFSILVKYEKDRDKLRKYLFNKGIETRPVFYPVHKMPMYDCKVNYPVAEYISRRGINLPSWPGLKDKDIIYICNEIKKYFN